MQKIQVKTRQEIEDIIINNTKKEINLCEDNYNFLIENEWKEVNLITDYKDWTFAVWTESGSGHNMDGIFFVKPEDEHSGVSEKTKTIIENVVKTIFAAVILLWIVLIINRWQDWFPKLEVVKTSTIIDTTSIWFYNEDIKQNSDKITAELELQEIIKPLRDIQKENLAISEEILSWSYTKVRSYKAKIENNYQKMIEESNNN